MSRFPMVAVAARRAGRFHARRRTLRSDVCVRTPEAEAMKGVRWSAGSFSIAATMSRASWRPRFSCPLRLLSRGNWQPGRYWMRTAFCLSACGRSIIQFVEALFDANNHCGATGTSG